MRGAYRRRVEEEEEESAFVSMTDMTVSFLFIVMILLAFFASQYSGDAVPKPVHDAVIAERNDAAAEVLRLEEIVKKLSKVDPLESYLLMSANQRLQILESLRDQLRMDFPDLQVVISQETDALRFQGDGLFRSGASDLRPERRPIVEAIATRLHEILPCYTLGRVSRPGGACDNSGGAIIEAVQIEGHTDAVGGDVSNLMLSTARANSTFIVMTTKEPQLVEHLNFREQPVLSVAGYGKMRPVTDNETAEGRATNRRIDLRIIMYTPSRSDEIAKIKKALTDPVSIGEKK